MRHLDPVVIDRLLTDYEDRSAMSEDPDERAFCEKMAAAYRSVLEDIRYMRENLTS